MKKLNKNLGLIICVFIIGFFIPDSIHAQTPLLDAVIRGNFTQVRRLVERGVDINLGNYNFTPLERAANDGHYEIVEYLLSRNAMDPQRAFGRAVEGKHIAIAKLLIASGKIDINASALSFRAFFNDQTIPFEQRMQIVFDLTDGQLNTPHILTIIEPENYQKAVDFFRINLSDKIDSLGRSILHIAASLNNVNLVTYLLTKNINVNALDNNNHTALFYCITSFGPSINWEIPIIEDEITARINYNSSMPYYGNPNDVRMRQAQVGILLLDARININQQNSYGWTALHFASASSAGSLETLISRGANQNLRTNFGRIASDLLVVRP